MGICVCGLAMGCLGKFTICWCCDRLDVSDKMMVTWTRIGFWMHCSGLERGCLQSN